MSNLKGDLMKENVFERVKNIVVKKTELVNKQHVILQKYFQKRLFVGLVKTLEFVVKD